MKRLLKPAIFGLLWLSFASAVFGATDAITFVPPVPETAIYAVAGASLIVLGLVRRRRIS